MPPRNKVAIAAGSPLTAAAGRQLAEQGGNVVDIVVAASLAATVSEILLCSLGGSAYLTVRFPGQAAEVFDGGDTIPTITQDKQPGWRQINLPYGDGVEIMGGHASVAVPGMLRTMELAWERHGSVPWPDVVAPALELARSGFPAGTTTVRWLHLTERLLFYDQPASRECFYPDGIHPIQEGEHFRIPHLDQTLEAVAREGAHALYEGDLAALFARDMQENNGFVTREDLAAYKAIQRKPLISHSKGFELALNPPPAVGGLAVAFLISLLEAGWNANATDAEQALLHARAQSRLLRVREEELSKADLGDDSVTLLLEQQYLRHHLAAMNPPHTTHLSVVSSDGAMAAVTMSTGYGAGITIPGTGITCNNSLGEPETNPRGLLSAPQGSRVVSNMAPTLAWHPDGRRLALGSPGASRITTSIAQVWARHALQNASFEEAVSAPRLHVERWHDGLRVQCEPGIDVGLLNPEFIVRPFDAPDMFFGAIRLVALDQHGRLHAVSDNRRPGGVETL